jgi:carboxymethylenebutenolidase
VHSYPDTQHGFHNDTTPRFNPEQARIAWNRTLEFWDKHLL